MVIADDHEVARQDVQKMLADAPDIAIVGIAEDGVQAQQLVAELRPRVLLLDLVMPGLRAWEVERWVRACCPETIVLVLTGHDRDCFLAQAVEAGVSGFLTKEVSAHRLVEAIRCAARGEVIITGGQMARAVRWREEVGERWECLTEREREVLRLLAQGLDNRAIAKVLRVSLNTVRCHCSRIYSKLGVANRAGAIVFWVRLGLVEESSARMTQK